MTYPNTLNNWVNITRSTFTVLAALNHSKNFAVYCLTSSDMRQASREYVCSLFYKLKGKKGLDGQCEDCGSDNNQSENRTRTPAASGVSSTTSICKAPTSKSNYVACTYTDNAISPKTRLFLSPFRGASTMRSSRPETNPT